MAASIWFSNPTRKLKLHNVLVITDLSKWRQPAADKPFKPQDSPCTPIIVVSRRLCAQGHQKKGRLLAPHFAFMKQPAGYRRGNENPSSCTRQLSISLHVTSKYVTWKVFPALRLLQTVHPHITLNLTDMRFLLFYLGHYIL